MVVWHYIHNLNDKRIQINIKSDIILKIQFCITCFCIVNDKAYPNFCLITIASSWLGQLYVMANNINISNKKGTTWYFLQIFVRFKALDTSVSLIAWLMHIFQTKTFLMTSEYRKNDVINQLNQSRRVNGQRICYSKFYLISSDKI